MSDHLGKAAREKKAASQAIKEKKYDKAWRHLNNQKAEYMKHANAFGFSPEHILALDGTVHEQMANVLGLEGKNDDALVHILYCVATTARPTKAQKKKVHTYFRRCKFDPRYEIGRADLAVRMIRKSPDYRMAQELVKQWRDGSAPTGGDK